MQDAGTVGHWASFSPGIESAGHFSGDIGKADSANLRQTKKRKQKSVLLNGWKEIANHVRRGVRTVQRWERDLGFPVQRVGNGTRAPVLAASEEVDQWLVHWGNGSLGVKGRSGPQDAVLLLKIAEARRSALHKKVAELMRRRTELLEATSRFRNKLNLS